MRLVAAALAGALALWAAGAAAQSPFEPALAPGEVLLEVDAVGVARGRADKAVISIPLVVRAATREAARAEIEAARARLAAAAAGAGVPAGDVHWGNPEGPLGFVGNEALSALTDADPADAQPAGGVAAETVVVTVRDVARLAEVEAALRRVHPGGISPPLWDVEDDSALLRSARDAAFARARADAEAMARTAGMRVVRILRISDRAPGGTGTGWTVFATAMRRSMGFDVGRPGEVERQVQLAVDFALAPR